MTAQTLKDESAADETNRHLRAIRNWLGLISGLLTGVVFALGHMR